MDDPVYHVMLEGRRLGPYDRRTIVGMRIKKTLTSEDVVVARDGTRYTVAELVRMRAGDSSFHPNRSGSYSLVQATYPASLLAVQGPGAAIPAFKGEIEARVQTGVLRIAGRYRKGLRWKDDRTKLALKDIVHARVRASIVDLWLRNAGQERLQRITLELFTPEAAGEFVEWLPSATPWPQQDSAPVTLAPERRPHHALWVAAIAGAVTVVVVVVATVLATRRLY